MPEGVTTIAHLCCGYPSYCDQDDYVKADKEQYKPIAKLLDESGIDQFSIEDAEAQNNLEELLPLFKKSTVILGCIKIARSGIETVPEVKTRIEQALNFVDKDRLVLAPDCGLGYLNEDQILAKLAVMTQVANEI